MARRSIARRRIFRASLKYAWQVTPRRFKRTEAVRHQDLESALIRMDTLEKTAFSELTEKGVPTDQWVYYVAFSKRAYDICWTFTGDTREREISSLITEYVLRGYDKDVLTQLADAACIQADQDKGAPPPPPPWEDLEHDYYEVDWSDVLTKAYTRATLTGAAPADYFYNSKARSFPGDFEIQFALCLTAAANNYTGAYMLTVVERNGYPYHWPEGWNPGIYVTLGRLWEPGDHVTLAPRISLRKFTAGGPQPEETSPPISLGTEYYCTLKRVVSTVTLDIYTDTNRTNLLASLEITYSGALSYIEAPCTLYGDIFDTMSGYIDMVWIKEG